jgi:hypothetical protein
MEEETEAYWRGVCDYNNLNAEVSPYPDYRVRSLNLAWRRGVMDAMDKNVREVYDAQFILTGAL